MSKPIPDIIAQLTARSNARKAAGIIPDYSRHKKERVPKVAHATGPCANLGKPTGELESCNSCRGRVQLKVFACAVYAEGCTIARKVPNRACCAGCKDYSPTS